MSNNENDLGGKVSLDTTNFKAGIADLNRQIKVIDSGFKAAAAGLGNWGSSAEGLQGRIQSLSQIIELQKKKIENLTEVYKKVADEKGKDSKAAQNLQIRINKETEALNENQRELDSTAKQLNNFGDKAEDASKKTSHLTDNLKKIAGGIAKSVVVGITAIATATAVAATGAFKLAEKASDLSEAQNVVQQTFKQSSDSIIKWSKTVSQAAGISQTNATKWVGSMGAMLKSSGLAEKAAGDMSKVLVQLTGDMSSFYNVSNEEMWDKIRAGISGETEPLKQLGINMSVANLEAYALSQGINKSWKEMSQAEQTTMRYNYLLSVTKDAQGDFGRTLATSFPNQLRVAKMQMEQMATSVGQKFLPMFLDIFKAINQAFNTGNWAEVGTALSAGLNSVIQQLSNALPAVASVAKTLITGFIRALADNGPALLTAGIDALMMLLDGILSNLDLLISATVDMIMALAQGLIANLPKLVDAAISIMFALVDGILQLLPELIPAAIQAIVTFAQSLIDALPKLIEKLPEIVETIVTVLTDNLPLIIDAAIQIIIALTTGLLQNVPLLVKSTLKIMGAIAGGLIKAIPELLATIPKMFSEMVKAFKNIDWGQLGLNLINGIIDGVKNAASSLINSVVDAAKSAWKSVKNFFGISSPSKLMRDSVGKMIGLGMAEGITESSKAVNTAMNKINRQITADGEINVKTNATRAPFSQKVINNGGLTVQIESINNNREQDIEALMAEMEFHWRRYTASYGGV